MQGTSYPYASAVIGARLQSDFDDGFFGRLAELPYRQAAKLMADSGIGADASDKFSPDALMAAEERALRDTVEEISPDRELTDLFWLENDAANLKLMIKCRQLGLDMADEPLADGAIAPDALRAAAKGEYAAVPPFLADGLPKIEESLRDTGDIQAMCCAVDQLFLSNVIAVAKLRRCPMLENYWHKRIDFLNLTSLLRARRLSWSAAQYKKVFMAGGSLSVDSLSAAVSGGTAGLLIALEGYPLKTRIADALAVFDSDLDVSGFASALETALAAEVGAESFEPFTIGPLANYIISRRALIARLRVIFAGKNPADGEVA